MTEPEFLEADVVLFLHDQVLREYGGVHGIKDEALLLSALGRPLNKRLCDERSDLFDFAAAYAYGIAGNHAFHDANKRTAWGCCVLFLKVNGVGLAAAVPDAVGRMLDLVQGGLDEAGFARWLRTCSMAGRHDDTDAPR